MTDHEEVTVEGNGRRDFLKKAGVAAWTIPAVQVANMTGALAGVDSSVTTTTVPPTTRPPRPCEKYVYLRIKAEIKDGRWIWVTGEGANDCLKGGDWKGVIPEGGVYVKGNEESATVSHELKGCKIYKAYHKAGNVNSPNQDEQCFRGKISDDGSYAVFTADGPGISHVELIVACCVDDHDK